MRPPLICWTILAAVLFTTPSLPAARVSLINDRLSLETREEPLSAVLQEFARLGVRVLYDPQADPLVTGRLDDVPLEEGLDVLLGKLTHVIVWDRVPGSLGPLLRLSEIHVFDPARTADLKPLTPPDANLQVVRSINGRDEYVKDELLFGFAPGGDTESILRLLREIGATIVSSLPELGIYQIRLPPGTNIEALAAQLGAHPLVAKVEPNFVFRLPDQPFPQQVTFDGKIGVNASNFQTPAAPASGVRPVAILDSGLFLGGELADMAPLVAGKLDALQPDRELTDAVGHGTQMALLATGATTPNGLARDGDQAGVPILAIRAFDDNGAASSLSILRGIDFAHSKGARVLSMSWGSETDSAFLRNAMAYAQSKGMMILASTGNEPTGRPMYPAAYPGVVGVSALNPDGSSWKNANNGDFTDIAAPGHAEFPVGHRGPPGSYAGTSIGAPFTARQLNLLWSRTPDADSKTIWNTFSKSLTQPPPGGPSFGAGALDAAALNRFEASLSP